MGFNVASVSYLSLATELSGEKGRSGTISVMWFVMIIGIILTAAALGQMLEDYSHAALERAFLVIALASLALGLLGLWGLEKRQASAAVEDGPRRTSSRELIRGVLANPAARRFFFYLIILLAAILGQDVLLEPYGGEAFGLPVAATTRITSIWGTCVLVTLLAAGWLERRMEKRSVARAGAWLAIAGFGVIALSGLIRHTGMFYSGVVLLGLGTGLSTVANLSLMLDMTTERVGLYIGAWGMADALARLLGTVLSGAVRDLVAFMAHNPVIGYITVFIIQAGLLLLSLRMLGRIDVQSFRRQSQSAVERAALLNEAS